MLIDNINDIILAIKILFFVNLSWSFLLFLAFAFLWFFKKLEYEHIYRIKVLFFSVLYSSVIFVAVTPIFGFFIWSFVFWILLRITLKKDDFLNQVNSRMFPTISEPENIQSFYKQKKQYVSKKIYRGKRSMMQALCCYREYKSAVAPYYTKHNLHPKKEPFVGLACMYCSIFWYIGRPQIGIVGLDVCNYLLYPVGIFAIFILLAMFYSVENVDNYSTLYHALFVIGITLLILLTYFVMLFGWALPY